MAVKHARVAAGPAVKHARVLAKPAVQPAVPIPRPDVISVEVVALALGVSTRQVRRWCESGVIGCARRVGREWVIAGAYLD